ncbi:hypothetical protein SGPC_00034 [Salmonella phage SGPC]|uniref:hypothetical protein n=1 Tax=Salmonella phage SGPC TaxID=2877945 RepID=UPI00241012F2|nr:hypothetical protein QA064_gp34 [Salmonella phage SGPC]UCR75460.1 hypothetical protein SGPC_00034 [Salmonella phage SGPC]
MKVKAAKVIGLHTLDYVTDGKVYDVYNPTATGFGYIVADDDCDIFIDFGNDEGDGFHGVKWEVVE